MIRGLGQYKQIPQDTKENRCKEHDPTPEPFQIAPGNGNGTVEGYTSYREFILGVRSQFDEEDFAVRLRISELSSPWIRVNKSGLYLVSFNHNTPLSNGVGWRKIPGKLITYSEISIDMTVTGIGKHAYRADRWSRSVGLYLGPESVTVLAFVISEAARFEAVYSAVDALLSGRYNTFDWLTFKELLNGWGPISNDIRPGHSVVPIPMQLSLTYSQTKHLSVALFIEDLARLGYPDDPAPIGNP